MILEVYKDIIHKINSCPDYFNTNRTYYRVLNDQLRDVLDEEIFSKMQTQDGKKDKRDMSINVNYLKKIVNKLSQLYTFDVTRTPNNSQDLFDHYSRKIRPNTPLQKGTEYYNAMKSVLMEIYPDKKANLKWRAIPNDRYYLYSSDELDEDFDYVIKIMSEIEYPCEKTNKTVKANLLFIYSDTEFLAVDTAGKIHDKYKPEEGWVNNLGFLPFKHINQDNYNLMPETDKDTLSTLLQVNSILTDATVANFYQAFPIITGTNIDVKNSKFNRNPNSIMIVNAPEGSTQQPELNVLQSSLQTGESCELGKVILEMIMDSKGLKVSTQNAKSNISGFQEMINNSDATEVRKIQVQDWTPAEEEMWELTARYHNWMVENGKFNNNPRIPRTKFSEDFMVEVDFENVDTNVEQQQNLDDANSGD